MIVLNWQHVFNVCVCVCVCVCVNCGFLHFIVTTCQLAPGSEIRDVDNSPCSGNTVIRLPYL